MYALQTVTALRPGRDFGDVKREILQTVAGKLREALRRLIRGWRNSCLPLLAVDSLHLAPWLYKWTFPPKNGLSFVSSWGPDHNPLWGRFQNIPPRKENYCMRHIFMISSKVNAKKLWVQKNF